MNLLRRLTALLILLALMVAAPIALWAWGRPLLPDSLPSPAQAWDSLTSQDTGALFMGALVVVGWVAWALFAVSVLIELAAVLAGLRGGGRAIRALRGWLRHLPVLGGAQTAAGALIGALLAGTLLVQAPAASAATSHSGLAPLQHRISVSAPATTSAPPVAAAPVQTTAPPAATAPVRSGPVWTVQQGDTLWDIAEHSLGDPLRYPEIVDLNRDVVQADGGRLTSAETWLEIGWRLNLPTDAQTPPGPAASAQAGGEVTVRPGDTLSQIALDRLGSADAYPELAAANQLTDPDHIDAGQVLVIPNTTTAAADTAPAAQAAASAASAEAPPATPSAAPTPQPAPADPEPPASGEPSPAPGTGQVTAPTPGAATPAPTVTDRSDQQHESSPAGLLTAAAGLTAAALLAGLLTARRRSQRRRRPGRASAVGDLQGARVEKAVRDRADGHDPAWVDRSLRTMAAATVRDWVFADVVGAITGTEGLRLQLAEPCPAPEPFTQDGPDWILPSSRLDAELADPGDQAAPLPALATVAITGDHAHLLDLERAQALHVTGPERMCREFLNHLAADLATNLWSDGLEVVLVGWGRALTGLNPSRLTHMAAVSDAVDLLRTWHNEVTDTLGPDGADTYAARLRDDTEVPTPVVLLVDAHVATDEDLQGMRDQLDQLITGGRVATAVILTGADDLSQAMPVRLQRDGTIRIGGLWADLTLLAPRLTDDDLLQLLHRAELADEPDTTPEPADDPAPWSDNMDVHGALLHRAGQAPPIEQSSPADHNHQIDLPTESVPSPPEPILIQVPTSAPDPAETDDQPTGPEDVRAPVIDLRPGATDAARQLAITLTADPDLDADLAAWNTDPTQAPAHQPRIGILGPVTVAGCGNPPRERHARYGELAVYLALHPRGVSADRIATDLWPESTRPPASGTIRELVSTLRQWLGRRPDKTQYLPAAKNGLYQLPNRLVDSELLRRLHKRAQAKADAADTDGALADYVKALSLVRLPTQGGVPPWEYTGQAYSWLHTIDHSDARHLQSAIADVSYETADLALQQQNLDVARWAAEIGHAAVPDSDRPLCQLLRVAKANGQIDTARRLVDDILQVNDARSPEQCPEWALAAIREVFPVQHRKAAAP